MKHKHADLMMQYAKDSMTNDKAYTKWEFRGLGANQWVVMKTHPMWGEDTEYRRTPEKKEIRATRVPTPVMDASEIRHNQKYWVPSTVSYGGVLDLNWDASSAACQRHLQNRVIYLTEDAAQERFRLMVEFAANEINQPTPVEDDGEI